MAKEEELLFKIVLVGDSKVGKTSILSRFWRDEFNDETRRTLGVEFATKVVTVNSKEVKAQIWDTNGQEEYQSVASPFYRDAVGAFLVYDISRRDTFEHLEGWLRELQRMADPDIVMMCVGNKCDLDSMREVQQDEVYAFAERHGLAFVETSAKVPLRVHEAFQTLLTEIHSLITSPGSLHDSSILRGSREGSFPVSGQRKQAQSDESREKREAGGCAC